MNPWHRLPAGIYSLAEQTPGTVLLESSRPGVSRISRFFTDPVQTIEVRELSALRELFEQIEDAVAQGQFAAGFFSYECGQYFEPSAGLRPPRKDGLLAWFGIYDRSCRFDHAAGVFLDPPPALPMANEVKVSEAPIVWPAIDEQQYASRINEIHEWIRSGDVYQLNFTFPLRARVTEPPAALYARLRDAQPVDYGAFLNCGSGRTLLSFSPELFFRIDTDGSTRRITTQPMKGTAHRGRTTAEDRGIASWLRTDEKNCAENVMIVDLIRNDLGRICTYGSVKVEKLFEVERYPTLWQMTSTITGDLRHKAGYEEVFRALFPCGSITGAPKVRAMQLLARIEEEPRGVYTGAIGFFSREQTVFNVAIRTLELGSGEAAMGVGGGIVIDSEADAEYQECRLKAEFLARSVQPFSLIETMRWEGNFPLLELHLDRLVDSAAYFDFRCDRDAVKKALLAETDGFGDGLVRKVRLLLDADGSHRIEAAFLDEVPEEERRVCIAAQRTDPNDRFLFHKTTHRTMYDTAFAEASAAGFADVLFLNTRGEVTEGAISNLLVEKEGRWFTPPVDCGLLAGVYRRHLLETRPEIEERILRLSDLAAADAVYLCNALRGLRRVTLAFESVRK